MRWTDAYDGYAFNTGVISGMINPFGDYHGVSGLMHRDHMINVVRPHKALLNAEYYLRPGSGMYMHPRWLSKQRCVEHGLEDGRVVLKFPEEDAYGFRMTLTYGAAEDVIDMTMRIDPTRPIEAFEIFFASYVVEAFSETWVNLQSSGWKRLNNRGEMNASFAVACGDRALLLMRDGRFGDWQVEVDDEFFAQPILVDLDPSTRMALIFQLDEAATSLLCGQYHGWDTAHDWSFGADLVPGEPFEARARLVYRHCETVGR